MSFFNTWFQWMANISGSTHDGGLKLSNMVYNRIIPKLAKLLNLFNKDILHPSHPILYRVNFHILLMFAFFCKFAENSEKLQDFLSLKVSSLNTYVDVEIYLVLIDSFLNSNT